MHTSGLRVHGRAFAHIAAFHPEITALRRDPHAHPELGFDEVYIAARVQEALKVCGVDKIHSGIGKTGVVAVIKGQHNESGIMLGLRADMDALPMTEHNDFAWKSATMGLMHGCGRDGHTAMLAGAARYLAETRNFGGTAVLIFQPGEEGYEGAKVVIEDGLFERFPVQAVYGMRNWPVDYERVYPAHQHCRGSPLCRRCGAKPGRARACGARPGAQHGGGRFFVHAAGQARRLHAPWPGRRKWGWQLLPAQQPL